ncbi:hypothetical protein B2J88_41070 [Rhodococcus sp. SRB_17]|nr:hypothetical protein [Rhodococcus sp. SRB_17]
MNPTPIDKEHPNMSTTIQEQRTLPRWTPATRPHPAYPTGDNARWEKRVVQVQQQVWADVGVELDNYERDWAFNAACMHISDDARRAERKGHFLLPGNLVDQRARQYARQRSGVIDRLTWIRQVGIPVVGLVAAVVFTVTFLNLPSDTADWPAGTDNDQIFRMINTGVLSAAGVAAAAFLVLGLCAAFAAWENRNVRTWKPTLLALISHAALTCVGFFLACGLGVLLAVIAVIS